jgi:hypothetical protein
MDAQDKKTLRDGAVLHAINRLKGAINDHKLMERIAAVAREIPAEGFTDEFLRLVADFEPEEYDYFSPGDYDDLRVAEMRSRGIAVSRADVEDGEVTFDDPLVLLKRLKDGE